jgi:UDP-N-acetylmuramoyl-L-alanyl-D-glutamate--2,6-diaminopimelate ligase
VVIAGKGHETYQIIGDQVLDFDDYQVAYQLLSNQ